MLKSRKVRFTELPFITSKNLFDTKHDEGKKDYEYLPDGRNKWDDKKYQSKLKNMSTVLGSLATDKTPEGLR